MYAQLDADFAGNPKILSVSLAAVGVYALGLSYAVRYLTDGLLYPAVVEHLCRGNGEIVFELINHGLWEQDEAGAYHIHDFLKHNMSAKYVKRGREAARKRMHQFRLSSREQTPNERGTNAEVPILAVTPRRRSRAPRQNRNQQQETALQPTPELSAILTSTAHAERASFQQGFTAFWKAYPARRGRKDGKQAALDQWMRLRPNAAFLGRILEAVASYAKDNELPLDAERWLKRRRWEDEAVFIADLEPPALVPKLEKPADGGVIARMRRAGMLDIGKGGKA